MSASKMVLLILFVIFESILGQYVEVVDYCSPTLCRKDRNIACGNDGSINATCASYSEIIPLTDDMKANIVKRHNEYRNKLALGLIPHFPHAARMAHMQWNDELATMAEYNVKTCTGTHDGCRNTFRFPHSGQNIARRTTIRESLTMEEAEYNMMHGIDRWFAEHKICPRDGTTVYTSEKKICGHFTVMVTEKNTHIGCAMLHMKNKKTVFTCNYAWTNMKRSELYTQGLTASKCATGIDLEFPGLCSLDEVY